MRQFVREDMPSVLACCLSVALLAAVNASEPVAQDLVPRFKNITREAHIQFSHLKGNRGVATILEEAGPGVCIADYNGDGWPDIYFVGGGDLHGRSNPARNALYRNNGDGTFTDVTEAAGVLGTGFGLGCVWGDYDNDGRPDLYVTSYGRNLLYHNNGNGTFTDVTEKAGVAAPGWSTCAVWFDYDKDGKLDLFVSSFVEYNKETTCGNNRLGQKFYCIPRVFKPRPSHLYHNNGNGTFTDVSEKSGITKSPGKSFGAVATDVNNDGWTDLFVANDTMPNFLFINKGNGTFEEIGLRAGVAFSDNGSPRSGMGVD